MADDDRGVTGAVLVKNVVESYMVGLFNLVIITSADGFGGCKGVIGDFEYWSIESLKLNQAIATFCMVMSM